MNETVIVVLIAAVVVGVIVVPFLKGAGGAKRPPPFPAPGEPNDGPDELAELELDRAMGRLSEEDYRVLRERATVPRPAAAAATAPDEPTPDADLDVRAEAMVARYRAQPRMACGTCGTRPEPGARYCSDCGRRLGGCPSCGRVPPQPRARFCSNCGAGLPA